MAVKFADLIPQPIQIQVGDGAFSVNPLGLDHLAALLHRYREAFLALYVEGTEAQPDYSKLMNSATDMVTDIIAMAADALGQEEDIKKLPGTVQLTALAEIWRLSVPDPKKLVESLSVVMGGLRLNNPALASESPSKE